jgi:hypothetical protein
MNKQNSIYNELTELKELKEQIRVLQERIKITQKKGWADLHSIQNKDLSIKMASILREYNNTLKETNEFLKNLYKILNDNLRLLHSFM